MDTKKPLFDKIMDVHHFHETFKIGNANEPTLIDEKDYTLRYNLIKEENDEYLEACQNGDLVEIADAIGDQLYILFGTICKHGLQHKIEEVFNELKYPNCASEMSHVDESIEMYEEMEKKDKK